MRVKEVILGRTVREHRGTTITFVLNRPVFPSKTIKFFLLEEEEEEVRMNGQAAGLPSSLISLLEILCKDIFWLGSAVLFNSDRLVFVMNLEIGKVHLVSASNRFSAAATQISGKALGSFNPDQAQFVDDVRIKAAFTAAMNAVLSQRH